MTDEEKMNICLSYNHEFGLKDKETQRRMMWELDEWLRALNNNGFKVVRKEEANGDKE